ncbi:hypothetical protein V4841_17635 [Lelliottia amnigena]|uniref:hypothetical protein n=1 Tax=Lelliottia amnigena TaxID=61646 RepID=UPI002F419CD2
MTTPDACQTLTMPIIWQSCVIVGRIALSADTAWCEALIHGMRDFSGLRGQ